MNISEDKALNVNSLNIATAREEGGSLTYK